MHQESLLYTQQDYVDQAVERAGSGAADLVALSRRWDNHFIKSSVRSYRIHARLGSCVSAEHWYSRHPAPATEQRRWSTGDISFQTMTRVVQQPVKVCKDRSFHP